jgi:hypothetical protein
MHPQPRQQIETSSHFTHGRIISVDRTLGAHWVGRCVEPTGGLEILEEKKIYLSLPRIELWIVQYRVYNIFDENSYTKVIQNGQCQIQHTVLLTSAAAALDGVR